TASGWKSRVPAASALWLRHAHCAARKQSSPMVGSTRSRPRFLAEPASRSSLPRLRGRAREGVRAASRCRGVGPLPDSSPQAGEGSERRATRIRGTAAAGVAILAAVVGGLASANAEPALRPYVIVGDAIPAPLTGAPGDPVRGRTIVASRQT